MLPGRRLWMLSTHDKNLEVPVAKHESPQPRRLGAMGLGDFYNRNKEHIVASGPRIVELLLIAQRPIVDRAGGPRVNMADAAAPPPAPSRVQGPPSTKDTPP